MREVSSLRWRLLWNLAMLLVFLMLASGLSAYWNGREAADTAYDRTLLASARTIAAGLSQRDGTLSADVPYVALDTFAYGQCRAYLLPGQRHRPQADLRLRKPARAAQGHAAHGRLPGPGHLLQRSLPGPGRARGQPAQGRQRAKHDRHGGDSRGRDRRGARLNGPQSDGRHLVAPGHVGDRRVAAGVDHGQRGVAAIGAPARRSRGPSAR